MPQRGPYDRTPKEFHLLLATISGLVPFLLYTKGGQLIKSLQQSRSKAKVSFFWAVASLLMSSIFTLAPNYSPRHAICIEQVTSAQTTANYRHSGLFCSEASDDKK